MSIWAEIKKAINSNLNLPLNEKIDRDIEENRIGHGFIISNEFLYPNTIIGRDNVEHGTVHLGSSYTYQHIEFANGKFYAFGRGPTGSSNLRVSTNLDSWSNNAVGLPYSMEGGNSFVYHDELYIMGGNTNDNSCFYKYDDNSKVFIKLDNLPFECDHCNDSIVYKDKVYIWNGYTSAIWMYDGSSWSNISISHSISQNTYDKLFIYKNELYLGAKTTGTPYGLYFYRFDESQNKFMRDSNLPFLPFDDNWSYFSCISTSYDTLYVGFSSYTYQLNNGEWYSVDSNETQWKNIIASPYIIIDDILYYLHSSYAYSCNLKFYKESSSILPKNSRIYIDGINSNSILAIENCEVKQDGILRVIDNGKVIFRIVGDRIDGRHMLCM